MSITYADAIDRWRDEREAIGYVQPLTARKSAQRAALLCPYFGDRDVAEIGAGDITSAIIDLRRSGNGGKGLSPSTVRKAHMHGKQVMAWACCNGHLKHNPFGDVRAPKEASRRGRYLDSDKAADLAAKALADFGRAECAGSVRRCSYALAVLIALATGMRRGEIFALKWDAVDFAAHRIRVFRAIKGGGDVGEPKSASGTRNVAIGKEMVSALERAKAFHSTALPARSGWDDAGDVICGDRGDRASMNAFEHWWRGWIAEAGYPGLHFHDLRHTHATLLIAGGVDVKTVQTRLGHSSAEITMSVYAHAMPARDCDAAASLDRDLFGGARREGRMD